MTVYIKYQCSTCRRTKDIERDPLRVAPNRCTITKGCSGFLSSLQETSVQSPIQPVDNLTDWYPRGESRSLVSTVLEEEMVSLATSSRDALVMAAKGTTYGDTLTLTFLQRRAEAVPAVDYLFRTTATGTVFTGSDANGKILRMDADAIAEDRVQVRKNGVDVTSDVTLTVNTVTFSSSVVAGSIISVRVLVEKEAIERTLTLTKNSLLSYSQARGAWSNVQTLKRFNPTTATFDTWTVFSVDTLSGLGFGKLKVLSTGTVNDTMFMLARSPYEVYDRYLDFLVDTSGLTLDFDTSFTVDGLRAPRSKVHEQFPAIKLETSAFTTPDPVVTTSSSLIIDDKESTILTSSKILGPK